MNGAAGISSGRSRGIADNVDLATLSVRQDWQLCESSSEVFGVPRQVLRDSQADNIDDFGALLQKSYDGIKVHLTGRRTFKLLGQARRIVEQLLPKFFSDLERRDRNGRRVLTRHSLSR